MSIISMPMLCLIWIALGVIVLVVGLFFIAGHNEKEDYYTSMDDGKDMHQSLEELFSYFLQEEEKKNEGFRELLKEYAKGGGHKEGREEIGHHKKTNDTSKRSAVYEEILALYNEGNDVEAIAKKLKKGIGEVNLILSLYNMR